MKMWIRLFSLKPGTYYKSGVSANTNLFNKKNPGKLMQPGLLNVC